MGMGGYRVWMEGDPKGVLSVNLVWAFFNTLMLGGALAVARNRSRFALRSEYRRSSRYRFCCRDGDRVAGRTENLSLGGVVARLVRSDVLERGDSARIVISLGAEEYTFPVTVNTASGSLLRLKFAPLDINQQAMLTRVTFGRADSWLSWRSQYEADRPLVNLGRIMGIALRGIGAALASFIPRRAQPRKHSVPAAAEQSALPLIGMLLLLAFARTAGAQAPVPEPSVPVVESAPSFHDARDLASLGYKQGTMLRGSGSSFALQFGLPMTRMVTEAGLTLRYRVSPRVASGSRYQRFTERGASRFDDAAIQCHGLRSSAGEPVFFSGSLCAG